MKPRVNILWSPGTNCHHETAYAVKMAGGNPKIILLNRIIRGEEKISDCDLFVIPGGFSWGDHIRAGWIASIDLVHRFNDQLQVILERRIPTLGICNGFQILAATGLLDGNLNNPSLFLDMNVSARFEHWGNTRIILHHFLGCPWTEGLDGLEMELPVAHGEGRPVDLNPTSASSWKIAATYGTSEGTTQYPKTPNGSPVAAISRGPIMGLMPHPERRANSRTGGDHGLLIFKAGIKAVT